MRPPIRGFLSLLLVCTACAAPQPSPSSSTATTSTPVASAAAIPTGVAWERTIAADEPKKFNITRSPKELGFAPDGTLSVVFKFADGAWTQFGNYDGGTMQPGDGGTYRYDEAGDLVLTTASDGSTTKFSWEVTGDRLSLRMLDVGATSSGDLAITRMMTEGQYRRATP